MSAFKTLTIAAASLCIFSIQVELTSSRSTAESNLSSKQWLGKWFPYSPDTFYDDNVEVSYGESKDDSTSGAAEKRHGADSRIPMGKVDPNCDDGKTNLTLDWDNSPADYMCFGDKQCYLPRHDVHPVLHIDHIPKHYVAMHFCMNESISYDDKVPTFGSHRPLWPRYGEYKYVPRQRWLHNLEHGALVMLYHPCAHAAQINLLKNLVRHCLYRHVITPSNLLSEKYPLVLDTWGARFEISKVDPAAVVKFVRNFALKGPEKKWADGQFDYALIKPADYVTDEKDSVLCPTL